jgi:hypothetical protein
MARVRFRPREPVCGWTGYDVVRIAVGLLLLTAAGLKAHQLATEPVLGTGLLDSRWLLMAVVEFELLLGLCLLANLWPKPTWAVALACFGAFTCVSLYKALSGHATCGCFGRVTVDPWYTATLDLSLVFSLLVWRPKEQELAFPLRFRWPSGRVIAVLTIWICVGFSAGLAMGNYTDTTLSEAGEVIGHGRICVLSPEMWVGKRFPLLEYIDIGDQLTRGNWTVLMYQHDCPRCREAISSLMRSPSGDITATSLPLALVEMPPYACQAASGLASIPHCVCGRLRDVREWFTKTPVWIRLRDGTVTGIRVEANHSSIGNMLDDVNVMLSRQLVAHSNTRTPVTSADVWKALPRSKSAVFFTYRCL